MEHEKMIVHTECPTECLKKIITFYEPKFKGNYGPITEIHNLVYNPLKDKLDFWMSKFEKYHRELMIVNGDWSDERKEKLFDAHMFKAFSNWDILMQREKNKTKLLLQKNDRAC